MNSKEQLPSHTDAGVPELPDALKQALREAYPDAGGRIAAKVMEQIRAEREEAEQRSRAEKLERRRYRQGLIMKYGGLAACMVILSGVLVIASPLMGRAGDNAAVEAAYDCAAETVPETAAVTYKTAVTADMAVAAEEGEMAENEAAGEVPMMLYTARSATAEAADADDASVNDAAKMMLADSAGDSRDAFLQYLIGEGYLTMEDFTRWQVGLADGDTWTVEMLCDAFAVDAEVYAAWEAER